MEWIVNIRLKGWDKDHIINHPLNITNGYIHELVTYGHYQTRSSGISCRETLVNDVRRALVALYPNIRLFGGIDQLEGEVILHTPKHNEMTNLAKAYNQVMRGQIIEKSNEHEFRVNVWDFAPPMGSFAMFALKYDNTVPEMEEGEEVGNYLKRYVNSNILRSEGTVTALDSIFPLYYTHVTGYEFPWGNWWSEKNGISSHLYDVAVQDPLIRNIYLDMVKASGYPLNSVSVHWGGCYNLAEYERKWILKEEVCQW